MNKTIKLILLSLAAVVCLTAMAFGQRTTGDVEGTVRDPKGAVVPGVSVTLTGTTVGFNRTVQSDASGEFRFPQVPAGIYTLASAATSGFATSTVNNVTVTIEKTTTVELALGVAGVVNAVDVSADPLGINIDPRDSKVQTNITAELISQLPKGGSFTSLLKVSPGTRPEPLSGQFQIDGASGAENSFVVDGQALENFRTGVLNANNNIPTSLVSEMQIKTGGFEAEHGGASGGVITVVTKSGSDRWHGEFGTTFEPSKLQPGPRFATTKFVSTSACATGSTAAQCAATFAANPQYVYAIRQNKDSYLNSFPTASLGGPIIKHHLWFYGNYSPQIFETTRVSNFYNSLSNSNFSTGSLVLTPRLSGGTPLAPIEYRSKTTNQYAFGRLDALIFSKLRVSGTYLWNPVVTDGPVTFPFASITTGNPVDVNLNGVNLPSGQYYALQGGRSNSNNITTQAIYTPTSKMVVTFRYGRAFLNEKNGNYAIPNTVRYRCQGSQTSYSTVATGCPGGIGYQNVTANSLTTRDASLKNEYNADATYMIGNFGGSHEFKGGYQYGTIRNDLLSGNAGTGIVSLYYGATFSQLGTASIGGLVAAENGAAALTTCPSVNATTCLGVGTLYRFGASGVASNKYQAIFFQDKWQPFRRLTLNLGVRAESENLPSFNADQGTAPLSFGWKDKIAPRLGAAYDLFGDGRTKIYGSYGWFYDRLKFELPRGSFGGNFYRIDAFRITSAHPNYDYYTPSVILGSFTDPIGGGVPATTGGISELQSDFRIPSNLTVTQKQALGLCVSCGVANDIKAFRQSEFTVGMERELSRIFVLSARFTHKNVDHAIEDHAIIGVNLGENYYIGNPGEGADLEADKAAGYVKSAKPQRVYNGFEIVLNKRLSNNYFFNLNYTLSKLYGNYSGLASSDEAASGTGRTSPGVNRFFDYVINGFTATGDPDNGNLPTDRRHAFKAYGGYNFNWWGSKVNSTELSFFQQILQGTPQTTFVTLNSTAVPLIKRGDLGRSPTFYQTDLSLSHRYNFGRDGRFTLAGNIDVLNAFNNNTPLLFDTNRYRTSNTITFTDIDPTFVASTQTPTSILNKILSGQIGTQLQQLENGGLPSLGVRPNPISATYGTPTVYQAARTVRFGFRLLF